MPEPDHRIPLEELIQRADNAIGADVDKDLAEIGKNTKICMDKAENDHSKDILGQIKAMDQCRTTANKATEDVLKR